MEMVWIEPGTFLMGAPDGEPGRSTTEIPQHQVTISKGFYLGKYEVTQGQWEDVMGTRPWSGQNFVQENSENPAVYISWDDTHEFTQKLNDAAGKDLYRLPTEAEWEYACRAGTTTPWSFGADKTQLGVYAWYFDNAWAVGLKYAQPVGTKKPNPWGLFDMYGNVWEWCQDAFDHYQSTAQIDPQGHDSGFGYIVRGGSFYDNKYAPSQRSANRHNLSSGDHSVDLGARLVRVGPEITTAVTPQSWGQAKTDSR